MKTAISVPDPLFTAAEQLANRRGWSRSRLYAAALTEFVAKHKDADVTARLNAIYENEDSSLDPVIASLQDNALSPEDGW